MELRVSGPSLELQALNTGPGCLWNLHPLCMSLLAPQWEGTLGAQQNLGEGRGSPEKAGLAPSAVLGVTVQLCAGVCGTQVLRSRRRS